MVFFDIDYTLFKTDVFKESGLTKREVYEEIPQVLSNLSKIATLGVFSEGETEWQNDKLLKTNLAPFFLKENIFIHLHKEDILKKLVDFSSSIIFLVDDKLTILFEAKKAIPAIKTIWIKRGPYALNQKEIDDFKPDFMVNDLNELVSIVQSN